MADRNTITLHREDVSKFVVHLTRDDRSDFGEDVGGTASQNLVNILRKRVIYATGPHCLHAPRLPENMPKRARKAFDVACFTEVPLSQIHLLTQRIEGVAYQREPYGIVFDKQALIRAGAQPAVYVNSYDGNMSIRKAYDAIFAQALDSDFKGEAWKILPFANAMHEKYDFTWEREWRTNFHFEFLTRQIVALILPSVGEDHIRDVAAKTGIACISPGWTYEMIIKELASQQRKTRTLAYELGKLEA